MTGSGGSGPSRPDYTGWLHQPLTPAAPPRPYPDGTVPPRRALTWRESTPGKSWQWALGAAAAVSALWFVASFDTSGTDRTAATVPDLRGYHHVDNLCAITDTAPYLRAGFALASNSATGPKYPMHQTLLHPAVDTMMCTIRLGTPGALDRGDDSTVKVRAVVHKQTDPGPEFTARFQTWTQAPLSENDEITALPGLGDEAYLVQRKSAGGTRPPSLTLAVRHGWTTYEISWLRLSSVAATPTSRPPTTAEAIELLRGTADTTLRLLRA